MLQALYGEVPDFSEREQAFFEAIELIKKFPLVDSEHFVNGLPQTRQKSTGRRRTGCHA